jgi:cytoskeletal protein CcmA (bactofilin family)
MLGDLTVRKCLTIHATGRVTGKIRYGKLVIEEGGELDGDIKKLGGTRTVYAISASPLRAKRIRHKAAE